MDLLNAEEQGGGVSLSIRSLAGWHGSQTVMDSGILMICRGGSAEIMVNFTCWRLTRDSVITLFPNDMVMLTERSADFSVEALEYSAPLLREASLQLEQTVYFKLRSDRCRTELSAPTHIINCMFALLKIYFDQPDCTCLRQLVLLQLKSFFMGFYDYICRNPLEPRSDDHSPRTREIFNQFMLSLENNFKQCRDVAYYARLLNITPKYLNVVTRRITGKTVKSLIDEYVVLQLKVALNSRRQSVKELAWEYRFSDISFFCRYFKQHTGMTPMQFAKARLDV